MNRTTKPTVLIAASDQPTLQAIRRPAAACCTILGEVTSPDAVSDAACTLKPDVLLIAHRLGPAQGADLACAVRRHHGISTVLVADRDNDAEAAALVGTGIDGILLIPAQPQDLALTIALTLARSRESGRLRRIAASLADTLDDRKIVERAKGILMVRHSICEDDAHHLLQRKSMREREALFTVAATIVADEEQRALHLEDAIVEPLHLTQDRPQNNAAPKIKPFTTAQRTGA